MAHFKKKICMLPPTSIPSDQLLAILSLSNLLSPFSVTRKNCQISIKVAQK